MSGAAAAVDTSGAGAAAAALAGQGGGNDAAQAFINSFPDNVRPFVQNKGWKDTVSMLSSYQNLEAQRGKEGIILPKDDDVEGQKAFRAKLGVPETPDKYEIKLPDGTSIDETFLGVAKSWMHEAGLSPKQAQIFAEKYAAYGAEAQKAQAAEMLKANETQFEDQMKEWGGKKDEMLAAGQRARSMAVKGGALTDEHVSAIEAAIGPGPMLKLFALFGSVTGEGRFVDGQAAGSHMTPESARAQMTLLKSDRQWFAKFVAGGTAEQAQWKALQAAAAAGLEKAS